MCEREEDCKIVSKHVVPNGTVPSAAAAVVLLAIRLPFLVISDVHECTAQGDNYIEFQFCTAQLSLVLEQ